MCVHNMGSCQNNWGCLYYSMDSETFRSFGPTPVMALASKKISRIMITEARVFQN
uniref:Uncharacterized protein n=1 Tax=Arundo donax TaxID=35708 RepID=A0A0A8YIE8_ARUDO